VNEPQSQMVSVREAATMLGWSEATVRKSIEAGLIPHIRSGQGRGSIRISRRFLRRVLDGETSLGARE